MLVKVRLSNQSNDAATYYIYNGRRYVVDVIVMPEFYDHVEDCVESFSGSYNFRGRDFYNESRVYLVKDGRIKDILKLFVKSRFFSVAQEVGIFGLHANGPHFEFDKNLKSYEDYEEAWSNYDPSRIWLKISHKEWEILVPHFAAWTEYAAKCQKNENRGNKYCFHNGKANYFHCLDPLFSKLDFFAFISDVHRSNFMKFLNKYKTIFT